MQTGRRWCIRILNIQVQTNKKTLGKRKMALKFLKNADTWLITNEDRFDLRTLLDVQNYSVGRNPHTGEYFLEQAKPFEMPSKLYGKTEAWTNRVIESFNIETHQTGVLLSGLKGSGKTMLAKNIAVKSNLPVIIVNAPYCDDRFLRAIQGIEQRAVIMFDEFEKVYSKEDQEKILTLFDGIYTAKNKIMILTCNDRWAVQSFFHNRPGRLRYAIHFEGLDTKFIREYCDDNLNDQSYVDDIIKTAIGCGEFNFDMLQEVVRELNRFGGTIEDLVEILNVKPHNAGRQKWKTRIICPEHPDLKITGDPIDANPIKTLQMRNNESFTFYMNVDGKFNNGRSVLYNSASVNLTMENLRNVDPATMTYTFSVDLELAADNGNDGDNIDMNITVKLAFFEDRPMSIYAGAWHMSDAF